MFVNLVKDDAKELVFKRSVVARTIILFIILILDGVCGFYFYFQITSTPLGSSPYVWILPMLLWVVLNRLLLPFSGPDDLRLDIERQTYTITRGFLFFSKVIHGSFGDFYGLRSCPHVNRRGKVTSYTIELDWNTSDLKPIVIAEVDTHKEAQARIKDIAGRLMTIPVAKD